MFGTYRTFLALMVVVHHLISIPVIGHYAVHGFFILSGYLMTYVMTNSYGYSINGIRSFAANRFLRLYPSYWVVLSLTILAILIFGEENSTIYREFIYLPDSIFSLIQNISLLYFDFFPGKVYPRLSPPTWALTIELVFYLLIALGASRYKDMTLLWFISSLLYMVLTHVFEMGYSYRYNFIIAGTLPFSLGAMIYHYYKDIKSFIPKTSSSNVIIILMFLFILNSGVPVVSGKLSFPYVVNSISFYVNYMINAIIIFALIDGKISFISSEIDKKIGDFSYPLYLMHWQAGFVSSMIIWSSPVRGFNLQGILSLVLALMLCFLFSWGVIRFVDTPIENLRRKIKKANKTKNSSQLPKPA
mgnify:CR=1 FL=1